MKEKRKNQEVPAPKGTAMNILHLKYAVEVADAGSINKAAESLYMGQPNLSRAIKELESSLGIIIFDRSARGMVPTADGEQFLTYARKILAEIDEIEAIYRDGTVKKQRFSISVPRASYIAEAFARFSNDIGPDAAEIFYMETNSNRAIENILRSDYRLGIIRYSTEYDRYFEAMLPEKGLTAETVTEFSYHLVMHKDHPLASKKTIHRADLSPYIEIAHADPYVPSLPVTELRKNLLNPEIERRIFVFERGSQYDLLSENHDTFMWVSPVPQTTLDRFGLVERVCKDNTRIHRDVLIAKTNYRFTDLDLRFIAELEAARDKYVPYEG